MNLALLKTLDLRQINFDNITLENIGAWPGIIKTIILLGLFILIILASYFTDINNQLNLLSKAQEEEQQLINDFKSKAFQSANLEAYKNQMVEMETSLGALLRQLPGDTEVPGLLDDISQTGITAGLQFNSIRLLPEKSAEFYSELPIEIKVTGGYHELGNFVSGVASLPRIVTLHDFTIVPAQDKSKLLNMSITAKTYRYNGDKP